MRYLLVLLSLVPAAIPANAAPPTDAQMCALALKNRPLDQLQDKSACAVLQTKDFPKSASLRRAVVVRVPLDTGTVDLLMVEVADKDGPAWHDLGTVAGTTTDRGVGSSFELHERGTLDALDIVTTGAGPMLKVTTSSSREMGDTAGAWTVTRKELLVCQHRTELICVRLPQEVTLAVHAVPDLAPYAWTRSVVLSKAGELVVGALQGTGELSPFDPGPGTHPLASLADRPLVRVYPIVPRVHPDAVKDDLIPTP